MAVISTYYHNCSDPNNSDLKSKPEKRRGNVTYQPELIQRVFKLDEYDERSREQWLGYVIRYRFFLFFSSFLFYFLLVFLFASSFRFSVNFDAATSFPFLQKYCACCDVIHIMDRG
ncbi:hypothetical protein RYX36_004286 [Vicia faba]